MAIELKGIYWIPCVTALIEHLRGKWPWVFSGSIGGEETGGWEENVDVSMLRRGFQYDLGGSWIGQRVECFADGSKK